MNIKFNSRKSSAFGAILILVSALLVILFFVIPVKSDNHINNVGPILEVVFTVLVIGLFAWVWSTTFYAIDKDKLKIKSGPFDWEISIQTIRSIRLNRNAVGGIIKPTLSWDCIEIEYENNKTISISPENQDIFIRILLDLNMQIEIK